MNSRERVLTALNHKEPDRVPIDFAQTCVSGINHIAYKKMRKLIGMEEKPTKLLNIAWQIADVDEDMLEFLDVDFRGAYMGPPTGWTLEIEDIGDYTSFTDAWGVTWRMPKQGGHYYDYWKHPLKGDNLDDIDNIKIIDPLDKKRVEPMLSKVRKLRAENEYCVVSGDCAYSYGFLQHYQTLQGFEECYMNLAGNQAFTDKLLDKIEDLEMQFMEWFLPEIKDHVDVIHMCDDYGGQNSLLISPECFRKNMKPRFTRLFSKMKKGAPDTKILFHCCGAVREIIPDLIEMGIDILNPVQYTAKGMELKQLKQDFGKDLSFWGGACDPQMILPRGTPEQVKDEVKRNLDILMPGGGYVFNSIHDIQSDVPPENIMAMMEAVQEAGSYR